MLTKQLTGGGFSIEQTLIQVLSERINRNALLIELGSGSGTDILLDFFQVVSIEHDADYLVNRGRRHKIVHAPLVDDWYKPDVVKYVLNEYPGSCLLIDGPPAPFRQNLIAHITLLESFNGDLCFDDINRQDDYFLFQEVCDRLGYEGEIIKGETKYLAYCTRQRNC